MTLIKTEIAFNQIAPILIANLKQIDIFTDILVESSGEEQPIRRGWHLPGHLPRAYLKVDQPQEENVIKLMKYRVLLL